MKILFILAASCYNNAMVQETDLTELSINKIQSNKNIFKNYNAENIRLKGGQLH